MIDETLSKIEERIRTASAISEPRKAELLELFGQLRGEVATLGQTNREAASNIAGHSERSATQATTIPANRTQLQESLDHLAESVAEFEESHPRLVALVNRFCVTLSGLGI